MRFYQESKKIMQDTDNRRAQIDEVITFIEKRLAELEGEQKELRECAPACSASCCRLFADKLCRHTRAI